ncbi:uncharacterized protein (DUF58 family) [Glycomyces algeriensis]|uniref:DUF58 domain-containing protein n=1 Tax=Glycomyces algeriensis TaxID=256037 RepID=A0A9W6GC41_9ACTN|nr:DUF58 domain-containing protein [Glycomyces algeriensis]MDA1365745.1 DUF58 domain-containing protein [Glycomyces algeriensis]MDR7351434.1 uncharacterized protein (DUF58 family) [Glycomyces algeriensis]GLI44155.1 hypothetical protein GALLR39Z86_40050 [Glycomyces algeriensis]
MIPTAPAEHDLRALDRLQLNVTRRLDGLLHGDYLGLLPGAGSEPGEAREYRAGDDVRRMDWPVTARTTVPHVRTTIADRELETWLAVDLSPSLDFGTVGMLKRELAEGAVAAFAYLAGRGGNRIGAVVTEGGPAKAIPPRPGRGGARSLLRTVTALPRGEGAGDLAELIDKTRRHARRRGLAIVISDFLEDEDDPSDWPRELRRLAVRQQVLCVEVLDPAELALPDVGVLDLMDPETGATVEVQTGNARFRARYAEAAAEQRRRIAAGIRSGGASHLRLSTGSDWLRDIAAFIAQRRHLAAYR